uniref:Elongator complex protein 2 n=2 Tax=Clastoptera arizonana TaxID=38151 RepID=A0A1B6DSR2_9HEMI
MVYNIKAVDCLYTSCACNCVPHSADWGYNGLICYGACNSIAIYNPLKGRGGKVTTTLSVHKGRVNSVRWIRKTKPSPENELVSASTDNLVIYWTLKDDEFLPSHVLKGHEGSVTIVDAIYLTDNKVIVTSASVDSTIRIWELETGKDTICKGVIHLSSGLALSLRLAVLDGSQNFLLASGIDDCRINIYTNKGDEVVNLDSLVAHQDWVRSLDFAKDDSGDLMLASGSQDTNINLWRFQSTSKNKIDESAFRLKEQILSINNELKIAVRLEAVLSGHDGWVHGVHWHPVITSNGKTTQPMQLLSASMDKTVIIWCPEEDSGVWLETVRVGEVGGNTLGFYGGFFSPDGMSILAHGFQGAFHLWRKIGDVWNPSVTVGGHFNAVSDIGWEPQQGHYLLSVSYDQTTRLHSPWLQNGDDEDSWHEIARPQVHGYDLVCLSVLPGYRFASGADEKVVRSFVAPQNFLDNFKRLCIKDSTQIDTLEANLPHGAAVPVLGLSNKAVFETEVPETGGEKHVKDQYENGNFVAQELTEPPTEYNLIQNTLWPEVTKLYGHGYELFSLASTSDGALLASACKATSSEHAAIMLWDTKSWKKIGRLSSHQLTVTQLTFSPDDQYLLSVSRDRRWSLFQKQDVTLNNEIYKLVSTTDKSTGIHTRIIWCCGWTHDSKYFATGSREGRVVIWGHTGQVKPILGEFGSCGIALNVSGDSVTSIAFASRFVLEDEEYLCAVGCDSGLIKLYGWKADIDDPWRFLYQIEANAGHHLTVKRLAFRPSQKHIQLASCGLDHMVKVHTIHLNKV